MQAFRRMSRLPAVIDDLDRRAISLQCGFCQRCGWHASHRNAPARNQFCVEIRPLVVATIQRLPQRTIESTRPTPGTVSPRVALKMPLGPSKTTFPPTTSRTVQPSMVVGLVSGNGTGLSELFGRSWLATAADVDEEAFCPFGNDSLFADTPAL